MPLLLACEERLDLVRPPPAESAGGNGGSFQRVSVVVTVAAAGEAAQVAEALGWSAERVPGAAVSLQRSGEREVLAATTDAQGHATFSRLLPGDYSISVLRELAPVEAGRLAQQAPGLSDVTALGGGGFTRLTHPLDSVTVRVAAGRRGSLVISELFAATPVSGVTSYRTGQYIEFYNNGDTTVHMDGKILARGLWYNLDWPYRPCSLLERWRTDPRGIWTNQYVRFPGGGRDYPVRPGRAVLAVMDAMDHRPYAPGMHDLTRADFEYVGSIDVDNPAVPNLLDVGPRKWVNVVGEGLYFSPVSDLLVLADGMEPEELVAEKLPLDRDPLYHLLPAAKILDVLALISTPAQQASLTHAYCSRPVAEVFDRQAAPLLDEALLTAIRRRVFVMLADGQVILQRTKTSAADFYRGTPTPGTVP